MRYFYLFIYCCITLSVFGQEYRPMLKEGARWNEYYTVGDPPCNFTIKIVGDTVLNGFVYKKLVEDPLCGLSILNDFRFLREDTIEKKIYETFGEGGDESVLYDFSLSVGDTFYYDRNRKFKIIDSITNNIQNPFFCGDIENNAPDLSIDNPRVYYLNGSPSPIIWVEGIGSLAGSFRNTTTWGGGFPFTTVLCNNNNEDGELFHYIFCEEPVYCRSEGVNTISNHNVTSHLYISIFPNPATIELYIDSYLPKEYNIIRFNVYDTSGRLVQNHIYDGVNTISVNNLLGGVYFLEILTDQYQRSIHKFIKQ